MFYPIYKCNQFHVVLQSVQSPSKDLVICSHPTFEIAAAWASYLNGGNHPIDISPSTTSPADPRLDENLTRQVEVELFDLYPIDTPSKEIAASIIINGDTARIDAAIWGLRALILTETVEEWVYDIWSPYLDASTRKIVAARVHREKGQISQFYHHPETTNVERLQMIAYAIKTRIITL